MIGARAATPAAGTLTPSNKKVTWEGRRFVDASTPSPEFCALPDMCDEFTVHVALGSTYWDAEDGAVQVGIGWADPTVAESVSEYDTFDLYVYGPDGSLIASSVTPVQSSMGIASTAQVVDIPNAVDGDYRVVVVPFNVQNRAYEGFALTKRYTPPFPVGDLTPDLHANQPTNFKIQIGTYSFSRQGTKELSCYAEETLQDPDHPTRCLRFDAEHMNFGLGPFYLDVDLSSARPGLDESTGQPSLIGAVKQIILRAEGGETVIPNVGAYVFHINHGHVHFKNFATYKLVAVNAPGIPAGTTVESRKSDFCMIDVSDHYFGEERGTPRTRHFPQCNALDIDRLRENGDLVQRQGIDVGWGDVYTWDLPGQYLNITGLPDGEYDVVNIVNPVGALVETGGTSDPNGTATTRIRIEGDTITCIADPYGCPVGA